MNKTASFSRNILRSREDGIKLKLLFPLLSLFADVAGSVTSSVNLLSGVEWILIMCQELTPRKQRRQGLALKGTSSVQQTFIECPLRQYGIGQCAKTRGETWPGTMRWVYQVSDTEAGGSRTPRLCWKALVVEGLRWQQPVPNSWPQTTAKQWRQCLRKMQIPRPHIQRFLFTRSWGRRLGICILTSATGGSDAGGPRSISIEYMCSFLGGCHLGGV